MDLYSNIHGNNTGLFLNDDLISNIGILAAKIAHHNFAWRYITLIMYSSVHAIGLEAFLMNYNRSVTIHTGNFVPRRRFLVPQFVVFGEDSSEISSMVTWLVKSRYDSTGKFVIICASHSQECDERNIFQTLAKLYIVNVVLLKLSRQFNEPLAYTYRIVMPLKCLNAQPERIDLINHCKNNACFKNIYPEKLSNFYRCPFIVSTFEQPPNMFIHNGTREPSGINGDILTFVAHVLNATLVLKPPRDGSGVGYYVNNNWTGSFGDLYNHRVHASMCSAPLTTGKYGSFQISFTYASMDIIWAARLPVQIRPWEKLLNPLRLQVRIILLFTFVGIVILDRFRKTSVWNKVRKVFRIPAPKRNLFFYSWMLFLGLPLQLSKKKSFLIILYTWIWFCFIMRSAYQAALIVSLKRTTYLDRFQNFKEALLSGYQYGGPPYLREYYREEHDVYMNWINLEIPEFLVTVDNILNGSSGFVLASPKEAINYYLKTSGGNKQLQIIPEKIVNSPTVIYFKKFSILTEPVSRILRVALESGIVERVYRKYLGNSDSTRQREDTAEPLNLHHFAGCFALLILGLSISILCFVVEVVMQKL